MALMAPSYSFHRKTNRVAPLDDKQMAHLEAVEKRLLRHRRERELLRRERSDILKVRKRIENEIEASKGLRENAVFDNGESEQTFSNKQVDLL